MHALLWAEDSEIELREELALAFPGVPVRLHSPGVVEIDTVSDLGEPVPPLVFARQVLLNAWPVRAESIRAWGDVVVGEILGHLPDDQPWALHVEPHYGSAPVHRIGARAWHSRWRREGRGPLTRSVGAARGGAALGASLERGTSVGERQGERVDPPRSEAGRHRCRLIREAVLEMLRKKRRHLLAHLRTELAPFTPHDSLVQLLLTNAAAGLVSVAKSPVPFVQRHVLSPFPKGELAPATDPKAPSRASAKLVEAEVRLGRSIRAGETCVDLGAAPGSWTYVARQRGARVVAVDRTALREDLMEEQEVEFCRGDAFDFQPDSAVDWLLCDVLASPERTAELLLNWLRRGWCRHFVVTLKLKDASGMESLTRLKRELPPITRELFLTRLCANKKEACAFGSRGGD